MWSGQEGSPNAYWTLKIGVSMEFAGGPERSRRGVWNLEFSGARYEHAVDVETLPIQFVS